MENPDRELERFGGADDAIRLCASLSAAGADEAALRRAATRAGLSVVLEERPPTGFVLDRAREGVASFTHESGRLVSLEASLWSWSRCDVGEYATGQEFEEALTAFDGEYASELEACRRGMGDADHVGRDPDRRAFRYALWKRPAALCVLGQTDLDP